MVSRGRSNSYIGTSSPVFVPRRRRYSEDSLRLTHVRSQHNLQVTVSKTIINRLATYGVDTRAINKVTIEHCLPIDNDWVSWEELLNNPLGVSDATLSKMLRLRPVSGSPPWINSKVKNGDRIHVLYIRSFILKAHELRDIIMSFHESGIETRTTLSWLDCINIMQPAQRVYVRYVGQTCRSGAVRFREDLLRWQRGFISKFFQVMGELYPQSLDSAAVYELRGSYLPNIAEQREQALIVLLGLPSLLNQRLWPVNLFTPNQAHEESFRKLVTRTIARLSISKFHPLHDSVPLEDWAKKVQVYAETHPLSVCFWKNKVHPFSDPLRHMIIEQGRPSAFEGKFVLFLVVGDRQTALAYRKASAFFSRPSDTSALLKGFLTRLWSWEYDRPMNPAKYDICRLIAAGAMPFVDLCPWLKAEGADVLEASHLLKEYTLFVKPVIILSLAARPSSVVASGFSHAFGYPQSCKFREKVGRLNLIHCGTEFCCIQIPCFHPGLARYSVNPETFAKVLDMTLWILLLAISVVLDSVATFEGRSREDWCIYIKNTVEKILDDQKFYSHYDDLKAQLHGERPKWCSTTLNMRERSHLAVASRPIKDRFLMVGFAVDEPGSSRRRQQAWTLWHLNIPELHCHINRQRKDDWFLWANNLTKGTSFLADASVSAILGPGATLASQECSRRQQVSPGTTERPRKRQKLRQEPIKINETITISEDLHVPTDRDFVPSSIRRFLEDLSFKSSGPINHQEAVELVSSELSVALLPSQLVDACQLLEQEWGISRPSRFQAQYQQSWNGAPVAIWRNSKFAIFWEDPDGHNFKFVLCTPSSTSQALSSKGKFIFFTQDGIDLWDDNGTPYRTQEGTLGTGASATFPLCRLFHTQDQEYLGYQLVRLWEQETGLTWNSAVAQQLRRAAGMSEANAPESVNEICAKLFQGQSRPLVCLNWSTEKLQLYQGNPQPSDALWLLQRCLHENWPMGGVVFIGDPTKFTWRLDNFWVKLWKFLASGKYSHHPRINEVSAWALDLSNQRKTAQVIANLKCFSCVLRQKKIQARDYERILLEKRDVKFVGTEIEISYDLVS